MKGGNRAKRALVTGVSGQDGAYLVKLLLELGYQVVGTYRRSSSSSFWRLQELGIENNVDLTLSEMDLTDLGSCLSVISRFAPTEIYNLAAQSFVGSSFQQPVTTALITGLGIVNVLDAVRLSRIDARVYQASTSEMFGLVQAVPQSEGTAFYPRSPYGCAKLYAHWMAINYREAYGIFAASGILFNHESPLRGEEFVTRKITVGAAKLAGSVDSTPILLGNLDSKRDWGFAGDYVVGMHAILQHDTPDTFILATNKCHTVRDFLSMALCAGGFDPVFEGEGVDETCVDKSSGRILATVDPQFYRPAEVDLLLGDYSKAKATLNWEPCTSLEELVSMMVRADIQRFGMKILK